MNDAIFSNVVAICLAAAALNLPFTRFAAEWLVGVRRRVVGRSAAEGVTTDALAAHTHRDCPLEDTSFVRAYSS